jgi:hypothetical protein
LQYSNYLVTRERLQKNVTSQVDRLKTEGREKFHCNNCILADT